MVRGRRASPSPPGLCTPSTGQGTRTHSCTTKTGTNGATSGGKAGVSLSRGNGSNTVADNNPTWSGGLLGLHALTALHPGSGAALGTVDLPVQRERHTHWPTVAGSAL